MTRYFIEVPEATRTSHSYARVNRCIRWILPAAFSVTGSLPDVFVVVGFQGLLLHRLESFAHCIEPVLSRVAVSSALASSACPSFFVCPCPRQEMVRPDMTYKVDWALEINLFFLLFFLTEFDFGRSQRFWSVTAFALILFEFAVEVSCLLKTEL